jgi:hypothetical protein
MVAVTGSGDGQHAKATMAARKRIAMWWAVAGVLLWEAVRVDCGGKLWF